LELALRVLRNQRIRLGFDMNEIWGQRREQKTAGLLARELLEPWKPREKQLRNRLEAIVLGGLGDPESLGVKSINV
jgi:hypothetical protein